MCPFFLPNPANEFSFNNPSILPGIGHVDIASYRVFFDDIRHIKLQSEGSQTQKNISYAEMVL